MVGFSSRLRALFQSRLALVAILVAAIVGTATVGVTAAATSGLISACVNNSSGAIHLITAATSTTCAKNETLVSWSAQGAAGPQGPAGPSGPQGATGATGPAGTAQGSACTTALGQAGTVKVTVGSTNVLTLTCIPIGFAANWSITPASHNYGDVQLGSTATFGFVVQNIGNLADTIPGFTLSPSLVGVLVSPSTTCQPATVYAHGATCLMVLDFTPQALGPISGTLSIPGFPSATTTITGNGTPAPLVPVFQLEPQANDWGGVAIGTNGTPFAFTLTNIGTGPSGPYSIQISGPDASQFILPSGGGCDGLNLAPGASCPILVNFAPTSVGQKQAALIVFGPSPVGSNLFGLGQ